LVKWLKNKKSYSLLWE